MQHSTFLPRAVLLRVLAGDGATSDSVHLTAEGHERMATAIWNAVGHAFEKG